MKLSRLEELVAAIRSREGLEDPEVCLCNLDMRGFPLFEINQSIGRLSDCRREDTGAYQLSIVAKYRD